MGLQIDELGVIVIDRNDVFTPPFAGKQRVWSLFSADDDLTAMFAVREVPPTDDLRLQDELAAWDAASDEAWSALDS